MVLEVIIACVGLQSSHTCALHQVAYGTLVSVQMSSVSVRFQSLRTLVRFIQLNKTFSCVCFRHSDMEYEEKPIPLCVVYVAKRQ